MAAAAAGLVHAGNESKRYARCMFELVSGVECDALAELWALLTDDNLGRTLGQPVDEPVSAKQSMAYLLMPRVAPEDIPEPLALRAEGTSPASMMQYRRHTRLRVTVDLLASDALLEALCDARLPPHTKIDCAVSVQRRPEHSWNPGATRLEHFTWLWWHDPWEDVDFTKTRFGIFRRDASNDAAFEAVEDLEQVSRRGARDGFVVMAREPVAWLRSPDPEAYDLAPLGIRFVVSDLLAGRLAELPGVRVRARK